MRTGDFEELGLDRAGARCGHRDARMPQLLVERLREGERPRLCGRVPRRLGKGLKRRRGGDREDRAPAPLGHQGREAPGQVNHGFAEDAQLRDLGLDVLLDERARGPEARVVDEDVNLESKLLDARRERPSGLGVGEIAGQRDGAGPVGRLDLGGQRSQAILAPGNQ